MEVHSFLQILVRVSANESDSPNHSSPNAPPEPGEFPPGILPNPPTIGLRSPRGVGALLQTTATTGQPTYSGNAIAAGSPQDLGTGATFTNFFASTFGGYSIADNAAQASFIQTYTPYVDLNGDGNYDAGECLGDPITVVVTINALPTVSIVGLAASYCANASPVALTGNPVGGSFSGPGVSNGSFDPAAALSGGPGPYAIQYSYTNPETGCSNTTSQSVSLTTPVVTEAAAVNVASLCAGFTLTFGVNCPTNATFAAELSDASGNFPGYAFPGTVTPGSPNVLTIPVGTPAGAGYTICVTGSNPTLTTTTGAFAVSTLLNNFNSTPTVNQVPACAGSSIKVSFTVKNNGCPFPQGNAFVVQLSDGSGSFANPLSVGTVTPGALNNVVIPSGTSAGTGYKLRVVSSNPALTSAASGNFKVKACGQNREVAPEEGGLRVVVSPNPAPEGYLKIVVSGAGG